jgi:hypothetical protein
VLDPVQEPGATEVDMNLDGRTNGLLVRSSFLPPSDQVLLELLEKVHEKAEL